MAEQQITPQMNQFWETSRKVRFKIVGLTIDGTWILEFKSGVVTRDNGNWEWCRLLPGCTGFHWTEPQDKKWHSATVDGKPGEILAALCETGPDEPSPDKNDGGGPAFPVPQYQRNHTGMSLRDYFAASCPMTLAEFAPIYGESLRNIFNNAEYLDSCLALFSNYRYEYADAMLVARQ